MTPKTFKNLTLDHSTMDRQKLFNWKKNFILGISHLPQKQELESQYEQLVNALSDSQTQTASGYLALWEDGKTDAEKIYFSRKTIEAILQKEF